MMNNNQQKTPGLNCPQCGLTLTINRNESKRAMEILKNVNDAQQNLNKASSFQR